MTRFTGTRIRRVVILFFLAAVEEVEVEVGLGFWS